MSDATDHLPEALAVLRMVILQMERLLELANDQLWEAEQACGETFPDLGMQPPINDTLQ